MIEVIEAVSEREDGGGFIRAELEFERAFVFRVVFVFGRAGFVDVDFDVSGFAAGKGLGEGDFRLRGGEKGQGKEEEKGRSDRSG